MSSHHRENIFDSNQRLQHLTTSRSTILFATKKDSKENVLARPTTWTALTPFLNSATAAKITGTVSTKIMGLLNFYKKNAYHWIKPFLLQKNIDELGLDSKSSNTKILFK